QPERWARFVVFGLLDGSANHVWYHAIAGTITGSSILTVLTKMAVDSTFYTPTYCFLFLSLMTFAEGGRLGEITDRLRRDFKQMVVSTWGIWVPSNAIIYGMVPLEQQVLASCVVAFCYTIALSLWE
ncbi:unnamed protein product, partial [Phaeothamnion confervicola]